MDQKKISKNSGKTSKNSGLNVNQNNYDDIKRELKRFLVLEIERYAVKAGSQNKLSLALGYGSDNFVQMQLKRASFSALERLWKKCREMYHD